MRYTSTGRYFMNTTSLPEDKVVKIGNLNLHYLGWGNLDAVPIVLIHGLCGNAHYWDFFARNVAGQYHLLAIDQRGHGDSSWAESYGPKDYVLDLETFVDSLKLTEFVIIGHSMGGINAIIYAAQHPDQVSALVIVDIGPEIAAAGVERMERERASEPEAFSSEAEAISYMRKLEPRQPDDFIRHQTKYALRQDEKGRLAFKYDKKLRDTELRSPIWLWEHVSQIICPALLIHGAESDMLAAEVAQAMAGSLAFGSVIDVEGTGHSVPGDNPEAFEAAVRDFLRSIELHRN
jgi:pimeloyl-ACP methyl ester carboxylesterase